MVRLPKGSVSNPRPSSSSAMRAYSICCAAVSPITAGISRRCVSTAPRLARRQHLLEQNPLVRHMLVDDPQPVAPRCHDEAVVNLAQRTQIAESVQAFSLGQSTRRRTAHAFRGRSVW